TVLALGAFLLRVTRSIALALAAQFTTLNALTPLANEPGHPQAEIVFLVVLALVLSVAYPSKPRRTLFLVGAIAATVFCFKVHVGIVLVAAVGLSALAKARPTRMLLSLRSVALVLFVILPWLTMKDDWRHPWVFRYGGLVSLSALPVALLVWTDRS